MSFAGTSLADWFSATFDILVIKLGSVCAFGTTIVLFEEHNVTSFFFSESGLLNVFAICLELFRGVKRSDSFGFSILAPKESFLLGECVERVRPLDGDGGVSSTDLAFESFLADLLVINFENSKLGRSQCPFISCETTYFYEIKTPM